MRPARKWYSFGRASQASGEGFTEDFRQAARSVVKTDALRRGVDSSVCDSSDRRWANGLGRDKRESVNAGTPDTISA